MQYLAIGFNPPVMRENPIESAAKALENVISMHAAQGWEFVGVQNHSTVVPGTNGCFGIGATPPYPQTLSIAVFRR